KPLIPVHHIRGHIAANYIAHPELAPPFVCLVAAGGHTSLIDVRGYTDMRVMGETRDDAAGEAFDKVARVLGLPYPGGPSVQKLAEGGDSFKYHLPRTVFKDAPYDFSFSGLKTAVINLAANAAQRGGEIDRPALAASFTRAVCDVLAGACERAVTATGYGRLAIAGGVAANSGLRAALAQSADACGYELLCPPLPLCTDNAAMIAAAAYYENLRGSAAYAGLDLNAHANMDVDLPIY
ncbi:MAG: tRNA (adenosine(37)-N6)-threonylcarbamoyltransferase complex transferase subunit TsaD, partial [Defluviitaleaceae bacterium]|nr:tRNA (adenosine(37)-N6)-threonylcarbamoyltransferase complex transferase subunit TsaD [Defluviitaleaceae bacterium]